MFQLALNDRIVTKRVLRKLIKKSGKTHFQIPQQETFEKQEKVNGHKIDEKQSMQTIKMKFDTKIANNLIFWKTRTIKNLYKKPCVFKRKS